MTIEDAEDAEDTINEAIADRNLLVDYFREEEPAWGRHGDDNGWSPAKSALELIRGLKHKVAAMERERPAPTLAESIREKASNWRVVANCLSDADGDAVHREMYHRCAAELELLSQAGRPAGMGWQDISTAPKDGTHFLGTYEFRKKVMYVVGHIAPDGEFVSFPGSWRYKPNRWMPLPSPPVQEPR